MIHVVHVITRTNIGGPSVMLVDLINGLDASRFRHTIIRGAAVAAEGDYLLNNSVACEVITLPDLRRSIGVFAELRSLMRITMLLRELRPDIVHTHMAKAGIVGTLLANGGDQKQREHRGAEKRGNVQPSGCHEYHTIASYLSRMRGILGHQCTTSVND